MTVQELAGYQLFKNNGCVACHNGAAVGGNSFQKMGVVEPYKTDNKAEGRSAVTGKDADRFNFKVPTLRNVELTYPYFHDGEAATLTQAVDVMGRLQLGRTFTKEERPDRGLPEDADGRPAGVSVSDPAAVGGRYAAAAAVYEVGPGQARAVLDGAAPPHSAGRARRRFALLAHRARRAAGRLEVAAPRVDVQPATARIARIDRQQLGPAGRHDVGVDALHAVLVEFRVLAERDHVAQQRFAVYRRAR